MHSSKSTCGKRENHGFADSSSVGIADRIGFWDMTLAQAAKIRSLNNDNDNIVVGI